MSIQTAVQTLVVLANAAITASSENRTKKPVILVRDGIELKPELGKLKPARSLVAIEVSKQHRRDKVREYVAKHRAAQRSAVDSHVSKVIAQSDVTDGSLALTEDQEQYRAKLTARAAIYGISQDSETFGETSVRADGSHARHSKKYMQAHTLLSLSRPQGFSNAQGNVRERSQRLLQTDDSFTAMASKFAAEQSAAKQLIDGERNALMARAALATAQHNQALNTPGYHVASAFDSSEHESLWLTTDGVNHYRKPRETDLDVAGLIVNPNAALLQAIRLLESARRHTDNATIPSETPLTLRSRNKSKALAALQANVALITRCEPKLDGERSQRVYRLKLRLLNSIAALESKTVTSVTDNSARSAYQFLSRAIAHVASNLVVNTASAAITIPNRASAASRPDAAAIKVLTAAIASAHYAVERANKACNSLRISFDGDYYAESLRRHKALESARDAYDGAKQALADALDVPVDNVMRLRA